MKLTPLGKLLIFLIGLGLVATAVWKFAPSGLRERLREIRREGVAAANRKPVDPRTSESASAAGEAAAASRGGWIEVAGGLFRSGPDAVSVDVPAFRIQATEVTNRMYARFLDDCPVGDICGPRDLPSYWDDSGFLTRRADHPVVFLTWADAAAYCLWAKGRLPTALEWEKAARGTDGRPFPSGSSVDPAAIHLLGSENRAAKARAERQLPTIAVTDPRYAGDRSPYGVLGMAGSVSEWTATAAEEEPSLRYAAGGSWDSWDLNDARAYTRIPKDPNDRSSSLGFRCAAPAR
jgi:formylglycine-generating enzyme required for sulfatase activity